MTEYVGACALWRATCQPSEAISVRSGILTAFVTFRKWLLVSEMFTVFVAANTRGQRNRALAPLVIETSMCDADEQPAQD